MVGNLLSFQFLLAAAATAHSLSAKLHPSVAPIPLFYLRPFYDGNDAIYTFGGAFGDVIDSCACVNDIMKFTISTGEFKVMNPKMPYHQYLGTLMKDKEGNIYHAGGSSWVIGYETDIYKYYPENDTLAFGAHLRLQYEPHVSPMTLKLDTEEILYFSQNHEPKQLAHLHNLRTGETRTKNITGYESVLAFSGQRLGDVLYCQLHSFMSNATFFTYNVQTDETGTISEENFPDGFLFAGADSRGNMWGLLNNAIGDTQWVALYNPLKRKFRKWEVQNAAELPLGGQFMGTYVEKEHRIYAFGGKYDKDTINDRVFYYDLGEIDFEE